MTESSSNRGVQINASEIVIISLFLLSLLNGYLWILFSIVVLVLLLMKNTVAGIKGIILYIIRIAALNSRIAVSLSNLSIFRYAFLFLFAVALIFTTRPIEKDRKTLNKISLLLTLFFTYTAISALINSSYPIVSITKCLLYVIVYYAVLKGVASTRDLCDWKEFIYRLFLVVFVVSLFTIPIISLRTKNGRAFQGILLHPNTFGVVAATFIPFVLSCKTHGNCVKTIIIILVLYMQYLSESRTGLLSSLFIIAVFFLMTNRHKFNKKLFVALIICFFAVFTLALFPELAENLKNRAAAFIYKGYEDNIFYSKRGPIMLFEEKFADHPIIGTGFMTPYEPEIRSFSMSFDLYVEQANALLAVLGELGIIGFLLWATMCFCWFLYGNKEYIHFFVAPFIVSFGEMVFFSSNSIGAFLYFCFAIYLFDGASNNEITERERLK